MDNSPVINIVGSKCRPQDEARFNKWYDEIHIPMLMKFKGLKAVTRYKLANDAKDVPSYFAIFEFGSKADLDAYNKSPELAAAREEMKQSWPEAGCFETVFRAPYQFLKNVKR